MRILHLLDAPATRFDPSTLALMAQSIGRLGGLDQRLLLLGGAPLRDAAIEAGLRTTDHLPAPTGRALLAWTLFRRWIHQHDPFDLVHCWSTGALTLSSLQLKNTPKILTLTQTPNPKQAHWLRHLTRQSPGRTVFLTISSTIRRALLTAGVGESAVHVLRPGLDLGRVDFAGRLARRDSWGPDTKRQHNDVHKVIALLGDPAPAPDAFHAIKAVMLAGGALATTSTNSGGGSGERGPIRLSLLIHQKQRNILRVHNLMKGLRELAGLIIEPDLAQPWAVLPGCDLALAIGPDAGGLSLLWAMAANVPIIGEARYAVSEIVEDRHSALLVKPGPPHLLSHQICKLCHDNHLAWRLRDTARHEAYSFFSPQRYCQSLRQVYEQVQDGQPVEVPALPQTGGLRYAGRV